MLNQDGVTKKKYGAPVQILANVEHQYSVGCRVPKSLGVDVGGGIIIAKAGSDLQARILKKVGADSIVFPELETGRRIANQLVHGNYFDAIGLSSTYSIMEIDCPGEWAGKSLKMLNLRAKHKVNVIAIKRNEELFVTPDANIPILDDDILVVIGENEELAELNGMR